MRQLDPQKTVYLIDGSSFLYRAYYALQPLTGPNGQMVQAVFGFSRMLKKFIRDFDPQYCALVWDSKGKTVRHELYADYKTTRDAAPSDLFAQKQVIQQLADIVKLHQVSYAGVEADDLMFSLAHDLAAQDYTSVIVTSDKDMRQTVNEKIIIFDPFKEEFLDRAAIETKYGFSLDKLPFYFALIGDASDNIPGVKGIGPKGAEKLVTQFASLHDVYENLDKAGTPRVQQLLANDKENAFLSEQLFTLNYHPTDTSLEELAFHAKNFALARSFFEQLNFKSLMTDIDKELVKPTRSEHTSFAQEYGYTFITVNTPELLEALRAKIIHYGHCAVDTETDSLNPLESQLLGISCCVEKGISYYIPVGHTTDEKQLSKAEIFAVIKPIFEDPTIKKYLHHAKYDALVLSNAGIELQGIVFDTLVAAGLTKQDGDRIGLKVLSQKYLGQVMASYKETIDAVKVKSFHQVPLALATDYAAADAHQTLQLVGILEKELHTYGQTQLFKAIEMPLMHVLYAMEREGILLEPQVLRDLDKKISQKIADIVETMSALTHTTPETLNLNSPQQVSNLLFTQLGLTPTKKTAKGTGFSTNQEVLEELSRHHVVPGLILQYRELHKLKSTYIDALPEALNFKTGRIHTTFNQSSVATGRLSSSDPNLQNIPVNDVHISIRAAFKARPGYSFIAADYSQVELRVLAHLSQDSNLLNAFLHKEDIHARTASGLFKVALDAVTHEQRQVAKRINFSILYGLTAYGLAQDLNISPSQAKTYIENYMAHYPQVQEWMETIVEETKEHGFVTTCYGRRRYLPGIYEKNQILYNLARRVAINTKVQGTAAELMKIGMVNLHKKLAEHQDTKIILQIHDELLLEVPDEKIETIQKIVQTTLENVVQWSVPFDVTIRHGKTWQDVSK